MPTHVSATATTIPTSTPTQDSEHKASMREKEKTTRQAHLHRQGHSERDSESRQVGRQSKRGRLTEREEYQGSKTENHTCEQQHVSVCVLSVEKQEQPQNPKTPLLGNNFTFRKYCIKVVGRFLDR